MCHQHLCRHLQPPCQTNIASAGRLYFLQQGQCQGWAEAFHIGFCLPVGWKIGQVNFQENKYSKQYHPFAVHPNFKHYYCQFLLYFYIKYQMCTYTQGKCDFAVLILDYSGCNRNTNISYVTSIFTSMNFNIFLLTITNKWNCEVLTSPPVFIGRQWFRIVVGALKNCSFDHRPIIAPF